MVCYKISAEGFLQNRNVVWIKKKRKEEVIATKVVFLYGGGDIEIVFLYGDGNIEMANGAIKQRQAHFNPWMCRIGF